MPKTRQTLTKFMQVRVKSVKFLEVDAIAIYFYDVTHHVESKFKLEKDVTDQKPPRFEKSTNLQTILQYDFRCALSMALMYLENLLISKDLAARAKSIIVIVVAEIN